MPPGTCVVELDRSARQGPPPPGQVRSAGRGQRCPAAQSGRAAGAPKGRDGTVEAIQALMAAKHSAAGEPTQTISQARALVLTGLDELRARFTRHTRLRWWPGRGYATASRCASWDGARMPLGPRPTRAPLGSQAEGFRPAAVTAPRHPSPSPGTSATRVHATPVPALARPGAMYLRNSG